MTEPTSYFPEEPYPGVTFFDAPPLTVAAVHVHDYPMADMPSLFDGLFAELFGVLAGAGAEVCGPALALHSRMPTDTVDMAVGVPTTRPLAEPVRLTTGRDVVATECPTGPVAATSYFGGYDGLGAAWGRFMAEVAATGRHTSSTFFEAYVTEPSPTMDPATLRTDLVVFLE